MVFGIVTAQDFLRKAQSDLSVLLKNIADASAAMNCILSFYHLHEWVWAKILKGNLNVCNTLGIRNDKGEFVAWLDKHCPNFGLLQELANGTKHCLPVSAKKIEGYGHGPFGIGPFGVPYLLIDLGESLPGKDRYLVASTVLKNIAEFWSDFFNKYVK